MNAKMYRRLHTHKLFVMFNRFYEKAGSFNILMKLSVINFMNIC